MTIKNTLLDFFYFIKRPDDNHLNLNYKQKIKVFIVLFLLEIIFTFSIFFPLLELIDNYEKIKNPKIDYSETFLFTFFFMVLLVPLVEEFFFRYILRYKKFKLKLINRMIWNKIFPYLVYFLVICFGIIHISNYENNSTLFLLLSPLIIISQLIGGFVITFIRVKISFIWGCIYHFIWNFIFIIFVPIIESQFLNPYEDITPKYTVKIIEKPFFNKDENQILKIDSLNSKIKKIEIRQYSLQHLLDTLYNKDKYYVDDVLINLDFNSVNYTTKEEFLRILMKNYNIK